MISDKSQLPQNIFAITQVNWETDFLFFGVDDAQGKQFEQCWLGF